MAAFVRASIRLAGSCFLLSFTVNQLYLHRNMRPATTLLPFLAYVLDSYRAIGRIWRSAGGIGYDGKCAQGRRQLRPMNIVDLRQTTVRNLSRCCWKKLVIGVRNFIGITAARWT